MPLGQKHGPSCKRDGAIRVVVDNASPVDLGPLEIDHPGIRFVIEPTKGAAVTVPSASQRSAPTATTDGRLLIVHMAKLPAPVRATNPDARTAVSCVRLGQALPANHAAWSRDSGQSARNRWAAARVRACDSGPYRGIRFDVLTVRLCVSNTVTFTSTGNRYEGRRSP